MRKLLSKLWQKKARLAKSDKGFTLIELLVVVVILGVLIAIAIPLYLNYRKGANDAAAQSDLRNAMGVLEVCNTNTPGYPATVVSASAITACTDQTINLSTGTTLSYFVKAPGYVMSTINGGGTTGRHYCYDSTLGGSIKATTTVGSAAGCGT